MVSVNICQETKFRYGTNMVSVMGKNLQTEATFQSEPGPTEWISQSRTFTVLYSLKKQRIYSTFSPEKSHAAHQTSYVW